MGKKIYTGIVLGVILCMGHFAIAQKKNAPDTVVHNPIPWEPIKETDILWKKWVWRRISVYYKNNIQLRNDPATPPGHVLANVLLNGIRTGTLKAYTNGDTALTTPLSIAAIDSIITCDPQKLSRHARMYFHYAAIHDDATGFTAGEYVPDEKTSNNYDTSFVTSCTYPQQVEFYGIKEDWIFDRNKGQMIVRITALAPMVCSDGHMKALFWLKYPDIRSYIAQYDVYNGKQKTNYNWDEYFESRQFSSLITNVQGGNTNTEVIEPGKKRKHRKHKRESTEEVFDKSKDTWVY